jgi:hypothetical protein
MMKRTRIALISGIAIAALAGGGVAFAASDSGSATPTASAPATTTAPPTGTATPKHRHLGWAARVEHGEFTMRIKGGDQVVDVQRGQVTTVSATAVTVKSPDGFTATYAIDANTKVHKGKQAAAIGDVHTGDRVGVLAVKNGTTDTVKHIADVTKTN